MKNFDVVVGASRKQIVITIVDGNKVPINLVGANAILLGTSKDLPGFTMYHMGTITNPAGGVVTFSGVGAIVTPEQMGAKQDAKFICRVRWEDYYGTDMTEEFSITYAAMSAVFDHEGVGAMMSTNTLTRHYAFPTAPTALRNTLAAPVITAASPTLQVTTAGAVPENNKIWEAAVETTIGGGGGLELPGTTIMFFDFSIGVFCGMSGFSADLSKSPSGFVGIELGSAGSSTLPSLNLPSGSIQLRNSLGDYTQWSLVSIHGGDADLTHSATVNFTVPLVNVNGPGGTPDPNYFEGHHVGLTLDPFNHQAKAWVDGVMRATIQYDQDDATEPHFPNFFFGGDNLAVGVLLYTGAQAQAVVTQAQWSSFTIQSFGVNAIGSGTIEERAVSFVTVDVRATEVLSALDKSEKRISWAIANAINSTLKVAQAGIRLHAEQVMTIRSPFVLKQLAIISFARGGSPNPEGRVFVGAEKREGSGDLLLSKFEVGGTRLAFVGANVAIPILGGRARPTKQSKVKKEWGFPALAFTGGHGTPIRGRRRTYIVPDVGVFQRTGRGKSKMIYAFRPIVRLNARLKFEATARSVSTHVFPGYLDLEVANTMRHHGLLATPGAS